MINNIAFDLIAAEHILGIHSDVQDIARLSDMPWKILPDKYHRLSESSLLSLLLFEPMICVSSKKKYYIIGGFRTWSIFINHYNQNKRKIQVPSLVVKKRMNREKRRDLAYSSMFIPAVAQAQGGKDYQYIGQLWAVMEDYAPSQKKKIFEGSSISKSRLPKELGKSFASFYPQEKKS